MKTLLRTFLLVASTLLTANVLSAAVVTLTSGGSYTVPGGQVAKIVTVLSDNGTVDMTVDGLAVSVPTATPPTGDVPVLPIYIASGKKIQLPGQKDVITLMVDDAYLYEMEKASTTPSNAVVIPTNSTGNYNVVLEGSADMVSWSVVTPGTYDASSSPVRFFRVRVEKQ